MPDAVNHVIYHAWNLMRQHHLWMPKTRNGTRPGRRERSGLQSVPSESNA